LGRVIIIGKPQGRKETLKFGWELIGLGGVLTGLIYGGSIEVGRTSSIPSQ